MYTLGMEAFTEPVATERLVLRRMTGADWKAIAGILQDPLAMYAYEHAFSDDEVSAWIANQMRRYREEGGLGLLAVLRKEDGKVVGQCGLTRQKIWDGSEVVEVGYLFRRDCWKRGYATEAAEAMRDYAFGVLGLCEVWAIIRDNNFASQNVARRLGMKPRGEMVKNYMGFDMPHICYSVRRGEGA